MESEIYCTFILAIALILLAGKIGGVLFERFLHQPAVLGELVAGIVISPFALGLLVNDPILFNFAMLENVYGVESFTPFEVISELAVVILLFVAGLGTNVRAFAKNIPSGGMVALGGVLVPFALGIFVTSIMARDAGLAGWMFMGATLTATSIGVTVRILMDLGRLQTKSGTIILVAAVVDDIISIVLLSIVLSVARTGTMDVVASIRILAIGLGIWALLLFAGVKYHKLISKYLLRPFSHGGTGTSAPAALIFGLILAYLLTLVDLHPVVGAYLAGLMFAATDEGEELFDKTKPIMDFFSPFFFVYLGMQVELGLLWQGAIIAIVLTVVAIIGKMIGCFMPAKIFGKLSFKGASIVGVGMVPRGEVGLIVASAGLMAGAISRELFGVALAVSMLTTFVTPLLLKLVIRKIPAPKPPEPPAVKIAAQSAP